MRLFVSVRSGDIALLSGDMGYEVRKQLVGDEAFGRSATDDGRWNRLDRAVFGQAFALDVTPGTAIQEVLDKATRAAVDRDVIDLERPVDPDDIYFDLFDGPPHLWLADAVTGDRLPPDSTVADVDLGDGDAVVLCVGYVTDVEYCLIPVPDPERMFEALQVASAAGAADQGPRLWGVLLYTDEDTELARYVRTHFDDLNVLTGPDLRIFVVERPARWSAARKYWRAHLEPELMRTLGALRWLKWQPYDRSRCYEIARVLGVPLDSLPALVLCGHATDGPPLVFPIDSVDPQRMRRLFTAIQNAATDVVPRPASDDMASKDGNGAARVTLPPWAPHTDSRPDDDELSDFYADAKGRTDEWYDQDAAVRRDIATLTSLPTLAFDRLAAAYDRVLADLRSPSTQQRPGPQFHGYNVIYHQGESAVGDSFHFHSGQTTFINRPVDTVVRDFQNDYGAVAQQRQLSELLRLILSSDMDDREKQQAAATVHDVAASAADTSADRRGTRDRLLALRDIVAGTSGIAVPGLAIIESLMRVLG